MQRAHEAPAVQCWADARQPALRLPLPVCRQFAALACAKLVAAVTQQGSRSPRDQWAAPVRAMAAACTPPAATQRLCGPAARRGSAAAAMQQQRGGAAAAAAAGREAPPPTALVYSGPGAGTRSVLSTLHSLREALVPAVEVRRRLAGGCCCGDERQFVRRSSRPIGKAHGRPTGRLLPLILPSFHHTHTTRCPRWTPPSCWRAAGAAAACCW